jgi:hypothetical protein
VRNTCMTSISAFTFGRCWIVRGNRKLRYRGTAKNDSWLHHRVAAINLRRLITLGLTHTGTNSAIA